MDAIQRESRGMFSPPNGNAPQIIPDIWKDDSGEVRTDIQELTDEELNAIGWKGPIQMPPLPGTSFYTHSYTWNTQTREYDVIELEESNKIQGVNYQRFWDDLIETNAFSSIKSQASQSLAINTITTEFIALISDAKNKNANIKKIQESLLEIVSNISFTAEELTEIQEIFTESGMFAIYTLE